MTTSSPSTGMATGETSQPKVAQSPLSVGLIVFFFLLLFCAMFYYDSHGGWASPQVYTPYHSDEELAYFQPPKPDGQYNPKEGKEIYERVCGLCHQPDGQGKPNQFPSLVGSEWALGTPNRFIRIPILGLNGPIKVQGQQWSLSMPAQGGAMTDEQLANVLSYIRTSWGNKGSEITTDQVKAVRAAVGNRTQPWTEAELLAVPEK